MDMDSAGGRDSLEVADYTGMLRRRWWLIVAAAAAGLSLAALAVLYIPQTFVSEAVVLVTSPTEMDRASSRISIDTESQRVRSMEVAKRAAEAMGTGQSPVALAKNVTVTASAESAILTIAYQAPSAALAQRGAHAFAAAYLDNRKDRAVQRANSQINNLKSQLTELTAELKKIPATDRAERELVYGQLTALGGKLTDAKLATLNLASGEIITEAYLPAKPDDPDPITYLPSGLMLGLLLGVLAALFVDRSDRRVRTGRDVARVLGMPVLIEVRANRRDGSLGLLSARSRTGQRFHELCHSLTATLSSDPGNHVILITGATPGPSGNIVAVNVAAALARVESNVLLVNADLRSRISQSLLGVRRQPGLAEALMSDVELDAAEVNAPAMPSLRYLPAGLDTDLVSEMLQGDRMARVVRELRERARYIVIEAPSTRSGADAQALAELADVVVMAVETPRTRFEEIGDGARQMQQVGAKLLGLAVIPAQRDTPPAVVPTSWATQDAPAEDDTVSLPVVKDPDADPVKK
ncbi:Wzz/FepE/Etk N-terminal domain-containing protein [Nonomuraea sp. NPDC059194]|uniref:Wzz/FepE/Etk N-terminal domain-containing protein n=1 Tax=Nonomuraea sp. NPDC059194 TaxID=3346764 RepID=UPI0036CD6E0A